MPRQLAGLYWDDQRRRYFPRHSRPVAPAPAPAPPPAISARTPAPHRALADLRSVLRTVRKDALIRQIQSSQILLTDTVSRSLVPLQGLFSAFQTVHHSGRVSSFAGDSLGWFYSSVDPLHQESDIVDRWQPQFHLSSEISSIAVSGATCVATSFGPECRILYVPLDPSTQGIHTTRIDSRVVHDVWATDLQSSRLVLGANKQAVVIDDIAVCTSLRRIPTKSDVLALAQRENVIHTGLRNGDIFRFDTRLERSHIYPLFDGASKPKSSITSLRHLRDYELLASFIDGGISTFDLRFPICTPLMTLTGNINSYTTRLPLATDPHEKFLFVAGQDNRIRLWSLITGGPALDTKGTGSVSQTALHCPFEQRIAALQVVEEMGSLSLWAASGTELFKYSLGHRSGFRTRG